MNSNRLKIGDVVRLKSGGPAMTVECPISDDVLVCCWFHEGKRLNSIFRVEMLTALPLRRPAEAEIKGAMN